MAAPSPPARADASPAGVDNTTPASAEQVSTEKRANWADRGEWRGNRPVIDYVDAALHLVVDLACRALVDTGAPLYARGTSLVKPVTLAAPASVGGVARLEGSVVLVPVGKTVLVEMLTCHARFRKYSVDGKEREISCPAVVAETIIARQGDWPFPQLRAVISAPTLRSDGSVLDTVGFDHATGVLFVSTGLWPKVAEAPKRSDGLAAIALLEQLISSFPFVGEVDQSAALAMILTALVRPSLATAPLFGISAPTPGTGKSKLVDIAAVLATGRTAAVMSAPREEAELKKQIDAALMAGDAFLNLDNIDHPLHSEFLCQVLSQGMVKSRVLGESKNLDLPTSAMFCATGNSLRFAGDLTRRVVVINLDARTERPEERCFDSDPVQRAHEDRAALVTAGLTVLRAFVVSGRKSIRPALGSFEAWSDLVRSALVWLGKADPLSNAGRVRDDDPERERTSAILRALPAGLWTTSDIAGLLREDLGQHDTMKRHAGLAEALGDFIERDRLNVSRFGNFLRKHRGRIVDGKCVTRAAERHHVTVWKVEDTS
jgi:putative DNA primase/helicase